MSTIFEKLIAGEIPCYKITEDKDYFAFLDNKPKSRGHILVVPKKTVQWVWEVEDMGRYFAFCQPIIKAQLKALGAKLVSVKTWGLEVPHAHIHLLPVYHTEVVPWDNPALSAQEFEAIAQKIKACLNK